MRTRNQAVRSSRAPLAMALLALAAAAPRAAWSQPTTQPADPLLATLIEQSLAASPEIAAATAEVSARRERIPQAAALPDPMLTLGIQNDGFTSIEIGNMETSFVSIMASQAFPWAGVRGLRGEVAGLSVEQAKTVIVRLRLATEATVRRTYLDLLLARDRLLLLDRLQQIWETTASVARSRYEIGDAAQSDVLRSQLELGRIQQRRLSLRAEEQTLLQLLNRLRARALDEPIETTRHIADLGVPQLLDEALAEQDAVMRSPELAAARLGVAESGKAVLLAKRSIYPDLVATAGVMPRGIDLPPMWTVSVGGTLPVFSDLKQNRAVAEGVARAEARRHDVEALELVLGLRVHERRTVLATLAETIRLYQGGLLIQSEATADATRTQYKVGKVSFASVLEANAGYVADEESYLGAIAAAQRVAIAAAEVSLDPVAIPAGGSGGMAATPMGRSAGGAPAAMGTSAAGAAAPPPSGTSGM